jgi:hypothetical protein
LLAIALGIPVAGCSNGTEESRYGETLPQAGEPNNGWASSGMVTMGSPGDRWLDTMQYVRVARDTRDGQHGYAITYDAPGLGEFTLFWPRQQIDLGAGPLQPMRTDLPISGGRLYLPDTITAQSLPDEHRAILLLENSYAKEADGFTTAAQGFVVVVAMGPGPKVVRAPVPGPGVNPALPAARVVATKYKPYTERNFRENLIRFTGHEPKGAHAHHVLPIKHADKFAAKGINIHDPRYGTWWQGSEHLSAAKAYNDQWEMFFSRPKPPSMDEILEFARKLAKDYDLSIHF